MTDLQSPPNSPEMEMSVLGAMLVDISEAKMVLSVMDAEWFYSENNRVIYDTLKKYILEGVEPDIFLASTWLTNRGVLGDIGGQKYLAECMDKCSTTAHTKHYIDELRKLHYDRRILSAALTVTRAPTIENVEKIRGYCQERDAAISVGVIDVRESIDTICEMTEPREKGLYEPFGLIKSDEILNGMMPGNLMTIASRPGVGKTVISTHMAMGFVQKYKEPVLYFSTEMCFEETMMRILAPLTKVEGWKFRKRFFKPDDIQRIVDAAGVLSKLPLFINDKPSPTLIDIRSAILATKPKLVIIDYLQRLKLPPARQSNEALAEVMIGLKNMARDMGLMAVVLSQLDRETDYLTGRGRPQLADLKGSGAIEAESDAVGLMWRHNKKDKDTKKGVVPEIPFIRPVELIFAKNRHGQSDVSMQLIFDEKYIAFREWNDEEEERCRNLAVKATTDRVNKSEGVKKDERLDTSKLLESGGFTSEPGED